MFIIPFLLVLFVSFGYLSFHFVIFSTDGKRDLIKFSSDISFHKGFIWRVSSSWMRC